MKVLQEGRRLFGENYRPAAGTATTLQDLFGISGICNILGSIKIAKRLGLGTDDNVITIATDGFDRYPSVMAVWEKRADPASDSRLLEWFAAVFRGADTRAILDVRAPGEKERLFRQKEEVWTKFGYSREYLCRMKSPSFWEQEYDHVPAIDEKCRRRR